MKLEMSLKKNVVGDLKFWKYFRTRIRLQVGAAARCKNTAYSYSALEGYSV